MKAVRLLKYGGQLVFNDVPTPAIARNEILVKIKSTAVNHLDLVEASGTARQILPIDLPWIPGHQFSGAVEQIGSDVAAYAPGDVVFGASGMGGSVSRHRSSRRPHRPRIAPDTRCLAVSSCDTGWVAATRWPPSFRTSNDRFYAHQDAAQAWKDIAGNLPGVHGMSPSGPEAAKRRSHGKIVLRVA